MNWERMLQKVSNIANKAMVSGNEIILKKCKILLKRYNKGERSEGLYREMDSLVWKQ